jgi:hypothetical protein
MDIDVDVQALAAKVIRADDGEACAKSTPMQTPVDEV